MNEKILTIKELLKQRRNLKAQELLNELEGDLERLKELEDFSGQIKKLIRSVGRSHSIEVSAIDELCVKFNITFPDEKQM